MSDGSDIMPSWVKRDWVDCPICGEPDMRREEDDDNNVIILCVNHACASNGGSNADALRDTIIKEEADQAAIIAFSVRGDGWMRKASLGLCVVLVVVYAWIVTLLK